jgi:hypothetical protein
MDKNKVWLVAVGLLIGGYFFANNSATQDKTQRDDKGNIEQSGDLGAFQIKVGDCFNDMPSVEVGSNAFVEKVTGVPCSGSHHWEAYAEMDTTLSVFNESDLIKEATDFCLKEATFDFIKALPIDRQNQIVEIYGDAEVFYMYPQDELSFKESKLLNCFIGSNTKYYTGSIRE